MRSSHPYSILHLHAEGATAITHKARPNGSLEPHFFYQSPKASSSLETALKGFFADARKEMVYVNVVSEAATLHSFRDTTLLKDPHSFAQVLEANSGVPEKDCDAQFLEATSGIPFAGNGPLLVNCFKRSDYLRAQAIASELGFEQFELFNNTLSILGAISDWRRNSGNKETIAVVEVGTNSSTVTITTVDGQIASKKIPVSIQDIAEGIQKELELKFESAALLLFYNGVFDFDQHKAAISRSFGDKLNLHLQKLATKFNLEIERLLISSLPPSYSWLSEEVPVAVELKGFSTEEFNFLQDLPDLGDCAGNPGFIGTAFCAHTKSGSQPWMISLTPQSIADACEVNGKFAQAAVPEMNEEAYVRSLEESQQASEPAIGAFDEIDDVQGDSSNSASQKPKLTLSQETIANDIFVDSDTDAVFFDEEKEEDPIEVISFNEKPKADPPSTKPTAAVLPIEDDESGGKRIGLIIGGIAAMLIVGVCAFFILRDTKHDYGPAIVPVAKSNTVTEEPGQSEQFSTPDTEVEVAESIPTDSMTEQPNPSESSLLEFEDISSAEVAEAEILEVPTEPLLPMGILEIESNPPGATVIVNGENKGTSPVTIEELQFGQYAIEFKLEGFVTQLLDVSVNSEHVKTITTELPLPLGSLEVHTTPLGVAFDVVSVEGLDRVIFSGVSPAVVPDIMQGQYSVQFKRDNWEDYSETVLIRYNETTHVDLVYPEGWLMIDSSPQQASVFEKGVFIGKTPLRLKGLKEGERTYALRHPGYEDMELTTTIIAQNEKKLYGELLSWDREIDYKDLDIPPTQTKRGLGTTQRLIGNDAHRFLVEFVISKEGVPEQIEVLETTYLRAHERLIKDISKWIFEPGIRKDRPVKTRVRLPIILGDVNKIPPAVELARTEQEEE